MSEHMKYMRSMTPHEQAIFSSEFNAVRKNPTTGLFLCLFLGGLGAHRFYLGQVFLGVIYASFCWLLFIPSIIALIEAFSIRDRVEEWNDESAKEIAERILLARPRKQSAATVTGGW